MDRLGISERRACKTIGRARATNRYKPLAHGFQMRLMARMIELAKEYGRYGYHQITGMLNLGGWRVNPQTNRKTLEARGLESP